LAAAPVRADKRFDDALAKAESQAAKGQTDEAVKTMQKIVKEQPTSEAHIAFSLFESRLGSAEHLEAAAQTAVQAVTLAGDGTPKAAALANLVHFDLLRASGREALGHAQEAVKAQENASTLAALARAQARNGDAAGALASAQKAVQADPASAGAQVALGEALLVNRKPADALGAFRSAAEKNGKLTAARLGLAQALLATEKPAEAVAEARKLTEADRGSGEAYAVLGTALLAQSKDNWSDAIAQAQQGAFLNPRSAAVQVAVGRIFEAAGNIDQAATAYKKALEVDPAYPGAAEVVVRAAAQGIRARFRVEPGAEPAASVVQGRTAEARKLVADYPVSGAAHAEAGRLLAEVKAFDEAVPLLQKAVQLTPSHGDAWGTLGYIHFQQRKPDESVKAYAQAVTFAPQNVDYRTTYGLMLAINDEADKAVAELNKVVSTPGYKDPSGFVNLGYALRKIEPARDADAVAAYRRAAQLDAKSAQAALGLGWALSDTKQYDESMASFQKAMELDPKVAGEANAGIAWDHAFKGDIAQAKSMLAKAEGLGRRDLRLRTAIERYEEDVQRNREEAEKRLRAQRAGADSDLGSLQRQSQSRNAATRAQAAAAMGAAGAEAVATLTYLVSLAEPDFNVRAAACRSLGRIGPAARSALTQVNALASGLCGGQLISDRASMEAEIACEDAKKACREAATRIGR
jgi:tetratricopeptide (TPR) repeat protein